MVKVIIADEDGKLPDSRVPDRLTESNLLASYVPKWKANTAYTTGQIVTGKQ